MNKVWEQGDLVFFHNLLFIKLGCDCIDSYKPQQMTAIISLSYFLILSSIYQFINVIIFCGIRF